MNGHSTMTMATIIRKYKIKCDSHVLNLPLRIIVYVV